ncbi:MAG TPA: SagB/ThcOx family dehydrogenase [Methylomirabilota bacterium]|jgi:SagB-type dehydrogenase family enzyme
MAGDNARRFHDATAHTPDSVRRSGHTLDWDNKPFPFKVYVDAPTISLPREVDTLSVPTLAALAGATATPAVRLTLGTLTSLLYYTAGVTKKRTYPGGGEVLFRAAASTGALYQTEVYVVAGDVDGLAPGLYHFSPGDFMLRRLRDADVRGPLAAAAADQALARRACTLVLTAIYWRNTWKYQARGYRHLFWDSGTMLANALAVAAAVGLTPRLYTGFVDDAVNRLLGVDIAHEAALELLAVGPEGAAATDVEPDIIAQPALPLSRAQVDYPVLREALAASALPDPEAVRAWREATRPAPPPAASDVARLPVPEPGTGRTLGETIQRRGSTRTFAHAPLTLDELGAALWAAARPIPWDAESGLVSLYLVVNAVHGLTAGAYRYDAARHALERLAEGDFRRQSAFLTLEQPLGGDAAAVIYFLAPLDAVLAASGDRGYRLVNLEAGIAGGRAYLAAYALGFGASGLTFYDREVVRFFAPRAAGEDAIFVTALGRAAPPQDRVLLSTPKPVPPRRS